MITPGFVKITSELPVLDLKPVLPFGIEYLNTYGQHAAATRCLKEEASGRQQQHQWDE